MAEGVLVVGVAPGPVSEKISGGAVNLDVVVGKSRIDAAAGTGMDDPDDEMVGKIQLFDATVRGEQQVLVVNPDILPDVAAEHAGIHERFQSGTVSERIVVQKSVLGVGERALNDGVHRIEAQTPQVGDVACISGLRETQPDAVVGVMARSVQLDGRLGVEHGVLLGHVFRQDGGTAGPVSALPDGGGILQMPSQVVDEYVLGNVGEYGVGGCARE